MELADRVDQVAEAATGHERHPRKLVRDGVQIALAGP